MKVRPPSLLKAALPPPPSYVDYSGAEPTLLVFRPVACERDAAAGARGFVGLRVAFVAELARVTRPGGRLVVNTPHLKRTALRRVRPGAPITVARAD